MKEGSQIEYSDQELLKLGKGDKSRREFLKTVGTFGLLNLLSIRDIKLVWGAIPKEKESEMKEGHHIPPEVEFTIFYSFHATAEDIKGLEQKIKEADIYIPELFGWREEYLKGMRDVSSGTITPDEFFHRRGVDYFTGDSFSYYLLRALYKSKKEVVVVDLPYGNPLVEEIDDLEKETSQIDLSRDFSELVESFKKNFELFSKLQKKREEYMLSQIADLKRSIIEGRFRSLKDKDSVKVLFSLGAIHTPLYHGLKKADIEVSRLFPIQPFVFGSYASEMLRRYSFNKEVDDLLVARCILGILFRILLVSKNSRVAVGAYTSALLERKVISRFDLEEIKSILTEVRGSENHLEAFSTAFTRKLREKKVTFPDLTD